MGRMAALVKFAIAFQAAQFELVELRVSRVGLGM
jgi:hypothetical protein